MVSAASRRPASLPVLPDDDELALAPHERRAVQAAADFAEHVVGPAAASWEERRRLPVEEVRAAAAAGLGGLLAPTDQGGAGVGVVAVARIMETLAAADMAFAFVLVVHNNLVGAIARRATAAQRERFLPAMISGERIGAFLLTEPGGGSDAAALRTIAAAQADGSWRLDGEKSWITAATDADVLAVYAQTDPYAGSRGIAAFLVEAARPGVERTGPYGMLGAHAMGAGGFRFTDVALHDDDVLVPVGQGFRAAMEGIDAARATVAAMCAGMLADALGRAVAHTKARAAFGRTIADFQGVQWMLADVATDLVAARRLAFDAARAVQAASPGASIAAAHAKKFATRVALDGIAQCMQTMGADGLRHDHPLARHLAGAKVAQYLDGATEIQNVVIARDLFADRGDGAR